MNKTILDQLNMLTTLKFVVDGKPAKYIPESFSTITFLKSNNCPVIENKDDIIKFENYIVNPFPGFDFHKKFNNNVPPPAQVMNGCIIKETEKMNYITARSSDGKIWSG